MLRIHTLALAVAVAVFAAPTSSVPAAASVDAGGNGYPQRIAGRVNDFAGLLSKAERDEIDQLAARIASTRCEVVVVTVTSIDAYDTGASTLSAFAAGLIEAWSIGDPTVDDGILMLVSPGDARVRIHSGEGHDGMLDEAMRQVIFARMLPAFDRGAWGEGIYQGLLGIAEALYRTAPAAIPTTIPRPPERAFGQLAVSTLIVSGAVILLIASVGRLRRGLRRRFPGRCARCAAPLRYLPSAAVEVLGPGRLTEQKLEANSFEVFRCTGCGQHRIDTRSAGAHGRYKPCPACRRRTATETFQTRILECLVPECRYLETAVKTPERLGEARPRPS